jgi:hypothetical protein
MAAIQTIKSADTDGTVETAASPVQDKTQPCAATASPEAKQMVANSHKTILPFALRDDEITARDAETLFKIAEDKGAAVGRLRRTPKAIPIVKPVTD